MSMVIGTVTNSYAVMSGDTRALNSRGIESEHFQKVFKTSDSVLLGITGGGTVPKVLIEYGYDLTNLKPSTYLKELFFKIGRNRITNDNAHSNILVIGKENNKLGFGGNFHTTDLEIQNTLMIDKAQQVWCPVLTPPSLNHSKFTKLYKNLVMPVLLGNEQSDTKAESIKKIQIDFIQKVSKLDNSVNDRIQSQTIIF